MWVGAERSEFPQMHHIQIKQKTSINFNLIIIMKKDYLKPTMEVVEIQLSDCIAGSIQVASGKVNLQEVDSSDNTEQLSVWGDGTSNF